MDFYFKPLASISFFRHCVGHGCAPLVDAAGGGLFHGVGFLGGPPKAVINVRTAYLVSVGLSAADLSCKIAPSRACRLGICSRILSTIDKTNF